MAFKQYTKKEEDVINPYLTNKQAQRIKDKKKHKELLREVRLAGRSDLVKEAERILLSNPTTRVTYEFTNPTTKAKQNFFGVEYSEFTALPNQPIIHGVITISEFNEDGSKKGEKSEDIYMYQPRFEGKDRFLVGPRYKGNGTLNNNAVYAYKDPETNIIYVGNIPKREIMSNRKFDFDSTNSENFRLSGEAINVTNRKLKDIVSIKYDTDPQTGYIRTVNLRNPEEKAKLDAYLSKYPTGALADDKIESFIHRIESQVEVFERINEKINESVDRIGLTENYQENMEKANAASSTGEQQSNLADENAKMINDVLKYGVRPTLASPIDDGIGGLEISRPTPPPQPGGRRR